MRVVAHIGIQLRYVGREVFDELARVYPLGLRQPNAIVFTAALDHDDPQLLRILKLLADRGFAPWKDHFRMPIRSSEFPIRYWRHYDQADLQAAALLEVGFTGSFRAHR